MRKPVLTWEIVDECGVSLRATTETGSSSDYAVMLLHKDKHSVPETVLRLTMDQLESLRRFLTEVQLTGEA